MSPRTEMPHWALIAVMILLSTIFWGSLPEEVDRFWILLLIPLVTAGLYLLFLVAPRLYPFRRSSHALSGRVYQAVRLALTVFMAGVHVLVVLAAAGALGTEYSVLLGASVLTGALIIFLTNVMQSLQPNGLIGIRTPWTLASDYSWEKTHRHGRWVLTLVGIVFVISGFAGSVAALIFATVVLILASIELFVYSYLTYKEE